MSQTFLIVGGGGREHALARQLALSPHAPEILAVPIAAGSPGYLAWLEEESKASKEL